VYQWGSIAMGLLLATQWWWDDRALRQRAREHPSAVSSTKDAAHVDVNSSSDGGIATTP